LLETPVTDVFSGFRRKSLKDNNSIEKR